MPLSVEPYGFKNREELTDWLTSKEILPFIIDIFSKDGISKDSEPKHYAVLPLNKAGEHPGEIARHVSPKNPNVYAYELSLAEARQVFVKLPLLEKNVPNKWAGRLSGEKGGFPENIPSKRF